MSITSYTKDEIDNLLATKQDASALAAVSRTGTYSDLTGKPDAIIRTTAAGASAIGNCVGWGNTLPPTTGLNVGDWFLYTGP